MPKSIFTRTVLCWVLLVIATLNVLVLAPVPPVTAATAANNDSTVITHFPNNYRVGIATHPWWLDMHLETFLQNFKTLKAGIIRMPVEWKDLEPQPGQYVWTRYDRLLNRLNDEGFQIVAEFVTIPPWASSNPATCLKADIDCGFNRAYSAQFEALVEATARRYPFVRHWEFWNEPEQWPNAGRKVEIYGEWLQHFYTAIKKADSTLLVAATTLAGPDYVQGLYIYFDALKQRYPWDAIAYHPYNLDGERDENGIIGFSKKRIERLRQLMFDHGEGNKPIWITEIRFDGSPSGQSTQMLSAFNWMLSKNYISFIALHMLHDWEEEANGLMTTDPVIFYGKGLITPATKFIPKQPYYNTFKDYPKQVVVAQPAAKEDLMVFPQTGHTLTGVFKKYWETKGGLELFGYPKTNQFYERNRETGQYYLVQYFERVRMEYHPDLAGTPFEVLFGLLGKEEMIKNGLLDATGQPLSPVTFVETARVGSRYFSETRHNVSGRILEAWNRQGGLTIIGYPLSTVINMSGDNGETLEIQYFERARIEVHTTPTGRIYTAFGLLGNQRLYQQGRLDQNYQPLSGIFSNPALPEFS